MTSPSPVQDPSGDTRLGTRIAKPSRYAVVLHNDDFTPMDFVAEVLMSLFDHSQHEAMGLTLEIHNTGRAVVGVFIFAIAEMKVQQVLRWAERRDFPLLCTLEREHGQSSA